MPLFLLVLFVYSAVGYSADFSTAGLRGENAYKFKDYKRAREYFDIACKGGHAKSCFKLGNMFNYGEGATRDEMRARVRQAKKAGTFNLSFVANDLTRDYVRARDFFDRACKGGYTEGCYYLAEKLSNGEGGPKNKERAGALYKLSVI